MSSPEAWAVALSNEDVSGDSDLLVHSCEDCACPVTRERPVLGIPVIPAHGRLVRARHIVELPVDGEHVLLFNPYGTGGVVVVNEAGRAIARRFDEPQDVDVAVRSSGDRAVVQRLVAHDIVHEPGRDPRPAFSESTELTVWLHVTNACNLRCPYCYVHKSNQHMDDVVGREAIDALVQSAHNNGFASIRLKYAGGEASLNSHTLLQLHDHAVGQTAEAGIELNAVLLSNGVAIRDDLAHDLAQRGIRIMISLDGIGAAHDELRPTVSGRPTSAMVERTIERLIGIGVRPHISITITGRNVGAVADVVRYALARDLTFSLNFFRDNDCHATLADLQYEEKEMIAGLLDAFAVIEEVLPRWSVLGAVLDRGQLLAPRRRSCGVGDDYVVVDQNGQIAQCHMDIGNTLGDIRMIDPVQAIRSDAAPIRNLLVEDKEGCRTCSWQNWCSGGCSVATFRATGRFDVRSPNCGIYKAIYPEALRLEGRRLVAYADR